MRACAHPYPQAQLIPATAAAGPPDKGCPSPRGTKPAQEGEEATATLSAARASPRPAADRAKQASLSVVATVSHPVELGSLLGKWPPALCQGQHWPSVGASRDVFPGVGLWRGYHLGG